MDEPPVVLDGARVLEYASFDDAVRSNRGASAVMGGVAVDLTTVSGLAIVEGLARGELFLLHCTERWETMAAGEFADVATAKSESETAYPGVSRLWRPYRALTKEESAEVESTRAFLRELLADDKDS